MSEKTQGLWDLLHMADQTVADYDEYVDTEFLGVRPDPEVLRDQAQSRCLYIIAESLIRLVDAADDEPTA